MAKTAVYTMQYSLSGDGIGPMAVSTSATNPAAPLSAGFALTSGNNTITVPSGSLNVAILVPPNASANAKSVKAINGDSNPGGWTSQTVVYPITGLSTFVINSAGSETIAIYYE